MLDRFSVLLLGLLTLFGTNSCQDQGVEQEINTITEDGAWCWFTDPRAIFVYNEKSEANLITGWVTEDGSIEAASINMGTGVIQTKNVAPQLDKDDHANPAFLGLENGEILMFYTKHFDANVRVHSLSLDNNDLTATQESLFPPFSEEQFKLYPKKGVTYANPFALSEEEGRIYCFGRWTGYKPNVMLSEDNGKTFSTSKVYITNKPFNDDNRPYVKYFSDGKSKIHVVFTDGHPRKEPLNSVYYACYEKGAFWRADGSKICDFENIPFEPQEATIVYRADSASGRAWVYDLSADEKGKPIILYARYPEETIHDYYYAAYDGKEWVDNKICHAGKWFPQTPADGHELEPHYSGGLTINPAKPGSIFLSRQVKGIFEIEKHVSEDMGRTWAVTAITENSSHDNVRPFVPRYGKTDDLEVVMWMENMKYIHYTNYKTSLKYKIIKN